MQHSGGHPAWSGSQHSYGASHQYRVLSHDWEEGEVGYTDLRASQVRQGSIFSHTLRCEHMSLSVYSRTQAYTCTQSCKQQFCPQHRFPKDHTCTPANRASSKQLSPASAWANVSNQTGAASAAAMAAIKRAATSTPSSSARPPASGSKSQSAPVKSVASSSRSNPFSATDR